MDSSLRFHPSVTEELGSAMSRYEAVSPNVGNRLRLAFTEAFDRIATHPEMYAVRYDDVRIARTRKFPYLVHYRIQSDAIQVMAIFHTSANPDEWKKTAAVRYARIT